MVMGYGKGGKQGGNGHYIVKVQDLRMVSLPMVKGRVEIGHHFHLKICVKQKI
jgi:hypothetical protein